jgi:hypothetical protein
LLKSPWSKKNLRRLQFVKMWKCIKDYLSNEDLLSSDQTGWEGPLGRNPILYHRVFKTILPHCSVGLDNCSV